MTNRTLQKKRHWVTNGFPKMVIVPATGYNAIQCLGCGMISHNQNDVENVYCGNCHLFGSLLQGA